MRLVDALCLIAAPERFVARATDHAITVEFERNRQLLEQFPDKKLPARSERPVPGQARSEQRSFEHRHHAHRYRSRRSCWCRSREGFWPAVQARPVFASGCWRLHCSRSHTIRGRKKDRNLLATEPVGGSQRIPLQVALCDWDVLVCRVGGVGCDITFQSTRTHSSRLRLRRLCWWSGHFYVMPLPKAL